MWAEDRLSLKGALQAPGLGCESLEAAGLGANNALLQCATSSTGSRPRSPIQALLLSMRLDTPLAAPAGSTALLLSSGCSRLH
jgi:hypothetical protein